jgi:hypothetical protein
MEEETRSMTQHKVYDLFVSYNSVDKNAVLTVIKKLRDHGIRCWFDVWRAIPGVDFQSQIETGIAQSKAIAIFVGCDGLGPWEEGEFKVALMDQMKLKESPIIPVLLPGAKSIYSQLPGFLRAHSYVDFSAGLDDNDSLISLIAGTVNAK